MPIGVNQTLMLEVLEEQSNEEMSPQIKRKRTLMMQCPSSPTAKSIISEATLQASLHNFSGKKLGVYVAGQDQTPLRELFTITPQAMASTPENRLMASAFGEQSAGKDQKTKA